MGLRSPTYQANRSELDRYIKSIVVLRAVISHPEMDLPDLAGLDMQIVRAVPREQLVHQVSRWMMTYRQTTGMLLEIKENLTLTFGDLQAATDAAKRCLKGLQRMLKPQI